MQEIRLYIQRRSGEALFRALLLPITHKKYTAPNGKLLNHTNLDLPALQFLQNIVEIVFDLPALPLAA